MSQAASTQRVRRTVAGRAAAAVRRPGVQGDYIRPFDSLNLSDVGFVGGKTASLGELASLLRRADVTVPAGFAITADAYRDALDAAGAWPKLRRLLARLDVQ